MRLFIGCSASDNIPKEYIENCSFLINELMKDNDLIFGAYDEGLMGICHDAALLNNRKITGVCPEKYIADFDNLKCSEEIVTSTVSERTDKMLKEADALVFLPGGIGTMYEFLAAIEAKKFNEIDKPIILYDCYGFYQHLLDQFNKLDKEEFSKQSIFEYFFVTDDLNKLQDYIKNYKGKSKTR